MYLSLINISITRINNPVYSNPGFRVLLFVDYNKFVNSFYLSIFYC